ncbi:MAG: histidine kinase dimerization/phospho-acceptor domain-containing protein, partial [Bacteroidota bacterium]
MKIKNKLRLGFGFLFTVVFMFGLLSLYYMRQISERADNVLKDNYESLEYIRDMRRIINEAHMPFKASETDSFNVRLEKEEGNITEIGEKEAAIKLRAVFERFISANPDSAGNYMANLKELHRKLDLIEQINMQAIVRKNAEAHKAVKDADLVLQTMGALTLMLLFTFSVNFPGFLVNPLSALLEGIQEISNKNYSMRLHFEKNDELGEAAAAFNKMADRLNKWENSNTAKLLSDKQRIETIIEQMQDAVIGMDEEQHVLFMNSEARRLLNIPDADFSKPEAASRLKNSDLFRVLTGEPTVKPLKIVLDGKEAYFRLHITEIHIPDLSAGEKAISKTKQQAGKVYVLSNITEFKERDEAKTNFIATVSHELKTPISSVNMSLKLLGDERVGHLNTEQRELLAHIKDDAGRLLKITGELLELSQAETGKIKLNMLPINPLSIIEYAVGAVKLQAEQQGISLEINAGQNLPPVQADSEKTAWVLINFLSNALRYSHRQSKIIAGVAHLNDSVVFSVQDFGKGIEEQYR